MIIDDVNNFLGSHRDKANEVS